MRYTKKMKYGFGSGENRKMRNEKKVSRLISVSNPGTTRKWETDEGELNKQEKNSKH